MFKSRHGDHFSKHAIYYIYSLFFTNNNDNHVKFSLPPFHTPRFRASRDSHSTCTSGKGVSLPENPTILFRRLVYTQTQRTLYLGLRCAVFVGVRRSSTARFGLYRERHCSEQQLLCRNMCFQLPPGSIPIYSTILFKHVYTSHHSWCIRPLSD